MKKTVLTLSTSIIAMAISMNSCKKDELTTFDCATTPTYTGEVKALMDEHCATSGCHDASTSKRGIDVSSYEKTRDEAQKDDFLGSIQHKKGYHNMPEDYKMTDEDIQTISCWVQGRTPE